MAAELRAIIDCERMRGNLQILTTDDGEVILQCDNAIGLVAFRKTAISVLAENSTIKDCTVSSI